MAWSKELLTKVVYSRTGPACLDIDHLLVRHDILHNHVFVFFADSLAQFLLIFVDQLLYIDVKVLLGGRLAGSTRRGQDRLYLPALERYRLLDGSGTTDSVLDAALL